jgi:glycosyltransferase involved in cell wall biosynthesis
MLTILHLITGLDTGGAERMLFQLATRTDRTRFRTVVVSMTDRGTIGPLIEAAGIPVQALGMRRWLPDPRGILRLAAILRALSPDIVQTWLHHADLFGLIMLRLGRVRHLLWALHSSDMQESALVRRLLVRGSARPDAVVTVSRFGQRFHTELGYRPRRWVYIPNGFDTVSLHPDEAARRRGRALLGIADSEIAILLPARHHPMKDHANFFAAAARLAASEPNARFVLAGTGSDALGDPIAAHGLAGRVLPIGHRTDLDGLYPAFDIVTLSSAYGEAFPMVLGEAMACGVPCVATDVGDTALLIGDAGTVVPARDPGALAEGWRGIIALAPEERRALGVKARAHIVANYDLERIVPRFEALYREIAG